MPETAPNASAAAPVRDAAWGNPWTSASGENPQADQRSSYCLSDADIIRRHSGRAQVAPPFYLFSVRQCPRAALRTGMVKPRRIVCAASLLHAYFTARRNGFAFVRINSISCAVKFVDLTLLIFTLLHSDMPQKYFAYVDEAGDEGFGKLRQPGTTGQSRWLCLGGVIAADIHDVHIPSWRDEILSLFAEKKNQSEIHFRNLNHAQRLVTCQKIAEKPIGVCVVASNKETILDSEEIDSFKKKQHLYNYLIRFLLERLTQACALKANGEPAKLHVTFSRRSGTDYQEMRKYFEFMRDGKEKLKPIRSIDWSVFDPADIRVENHAVRAGLQIADVVTSATFCALEPDKYGNVEPRYALSLKPRYLHVKRTISNHGLTLIPPPWKSPLNDDQKRFISNMQKR
ncbi:DUF3800 domain-containing protein [Hoeflea sp.]|uniref:DUF3800 domain-containing protein n=1 Tax=Hoeflea sp. TaxID=1940281 RepID=UPI0025B7C64B|nr:DUF3800 domain-containing protein [Hoeflea sp.]